MRRNLIRLSIVASGTAAGAILTFAVGAVAWAKTGTYFHG